MVDHHPGPENCEKSLKMKIDRIELFHVSIPLGKPFLPAWIPGYPQTANRCTLARLTTDDGVQGIAAGVAFEREREGLGSLLGPYLIGLDPTDIATGRQRIREASYLGWSNFWLEAAFWDILGKVENQPVWKLLGGSGPGQGARVPVYASTGEIHPPAQRAEEVLRLRDMGFKTVKLRVHSFDPAEDIAQIETVRKAVGDSLEIGVDANQGWRVALVDDAPLWDLERATEFSRACAGNDIAWLEPTPPLAAESVTRKKSCRPAVNRVCALRRTPGPMASAWSSTCTCTPPVHGTTRWNTRMSPRAGFRKYATACWRSPSWPIRTEPSQYRTSPAWASK
jgi:L-alanine-DL-glutamate epimerase-like enolase superfamily enzyme